MIREANLSGGARSLLLADSVAAPDGFLDFEVAAGSVEEIEVNILGATRLATCSGLFEGEPLLKF